MERRKFISAVTGSIAVSVLAACRKNLPDVSETSVEEQAMSDARGGGGSITRYPLHIPSPLSQSYLNAAQTSSDLGGGNISKVLAYNGTFPGPTLRANRGDTVNINFQNNLTEESIIHWHGMIVNHANDGHPSEAVSPGASYSYNYIINQRAALNWYHPHPHMLTGEQVYYGLAGAFIVNDAEEASLNLPSGEYEIPLIIRDATLDRNGNLDYKPRSGGFLGNIPLVNGTLSPYLNVKKGVYRFRILNGANSRIFGLTLANGANFMLIGNDGGLLTTSSNQSRLDIAGGERLDILIDFRSYSAGTNLMLLDIRSGWNLLEFRVTNEAGFSPASLPTSLSTIEPLSAPVTTRVFSFDGMSKINGLVYDVNRIDFTVPFGQTEKWRFTTNGNAPHPVHVHGASFQVISRTGGRGQLFPWEAGWKDTVLLEDQERVEVLIKFSNYKGVYLIHCHKLEHEDMGMMSNFEVV